MSDSLTGVAVSPGRASGPVIRVAEPLGEPAATPAPADPAAEAARIGPPAPPAAAAGPPPAAGPAAGGRKNRPEPPPGGAATILITTAAMAADPALASQ